nr:hypothetical protein CFP56_01336 [Quercus suber]
MRSGRSRRRRMGGAVDDDAILGQLSSSRLLHVMAHWMRERARWVIRGRVPYSRCRVRVLEGEWEWRLCRWLWSVLPEGKLRGGGHDGSAGRARARLRRDLVAEHVGEGAKGTVELPGDLPCGLLARWFDGRDATNVLVVAAPRLQWTVADG